jgi:hypothetical protein
LRRSDFVATAPLTETLPSSISRWTCARDKSAIALAMTASRRPPACSAVTTNS